jgi:electron transfer flavoprotein alpha subunit
LIGLVASLYGPEEAHKSIWIYLEHKDGQLQDVSLELIAKSLALCEGSDWTVCGLILGEDLAQPAAEAGSKGLDEVLVVHHPLLKTFDVAAYTRASFEIVVREKPAVFLLGATPDARDLAGRLAVRLRTGLNADCTDLRLDPKSGQLVSEVSGFGGGVIALLESPRHRPQMSTVRPGVFEQEFPPLENKSEIREVAIELTEADLQSEVLERVVGEQLDLSKAEILVCGGRGVHGDFETLQQLASQLGGDVGATRPPVDDGYIERERQIGQTGVVCRPKLVLNFGISGAFHYIVGIQDADMVIAVNVDPDAPIFDYCDYGIVADAHQILPALINALSKEPDAAHA